jgi:CO dehydrogenase maturation factor
MISSHSLVCRVRSDGLTFGLGPENVNKLPGANRPGEVRVKIAVSGKGGVGKTLIAGGLAYFFADEGMKTIAVDADPSPNLAFTLGLSAEEARGILPISENKKLIESKTSTGYSGVFRLSFTVDDIVREYSIKTPMGVNLIVMGTVQSMGSGCTCPANAVIRALLRHLVVEREEVVILDMEAGVEHIGRGTARNVDTMLIVSDASMKALEIARHIYELVAKSGMKQVFLVGNKVADNIQKETVETFAKNNSMEIMDFVPFDQKVVEAEMKGESPIKHEESKAVTAIEKLCKKLTARNY